MLHQQIRSGETVHARNRTREQDLDLRHGLSGRQVEVVLAGGLINWMRERLGEERPGCSVPSGAGT